MSVMCCQCLFSNICTHICSIVEVTNSHELDGEFQFPSDLIVVTQNCLKPGLNTAIEKEG